MRRSYKPVPDPTLDTKSLARPASISSLTRRQAVEPPHRFVVTWHPGRAADTAQEVEIRFVAVTGGTRVELEHRGWTKLGKDAAAARESYAEGWPFVFDHCFVEGCS